MIYVLVTLIALSLVALGLWLGRRQNRPNQARGGRGGSVDEVDDELRGVFINEVKSEIGNLRRNLMLWKAAPTNLGRLMPLRRSFHTLKGSSRMVGVPALGDFNARFERLLDRVIDKSLNPDPPVVAVVEQAVGALPELLAQYEGIRSPRVDIAAIMKTADRLIKSERAVVRPLRPSTASGSDYAGTAAALVLGSAAAAQLAAEQSELQSGVASGEGGYESSSYGGDGAAAPDSGGTSGVD
jgi:chemotaxis protein histidine kinase CheA